MSDEPAHSPEISENSSPNGAPRVRRISNPRIKKSAASVQEPTAAAEPPASATHSDFPEDLPIRNDWPESEPSSPGPLSPPENPKRKRRRKKGKGNVSQNGALPQESESPGIASDETNESPSGQQPASHQAKRPSAPPRMKFDPVLLAERAWKIYLSEVSEEGVALINDHDAKELSRRCFRLAEIFLEEQSRRS
jgi:hypothetical protein